MKQLLNLKDELRLSVKELNNQSITGKAQNKNINFIEIDRIDARCNNFLFISHSWRDY